MSTTSNKSNAVVPPSSLLLNFLQTATKELEEDLALTIDDDGFHSRSAIRELLLQRQGECLERVVAEFNNTNSTNSTMFSVEDVQNELKALSSQKEGASDTQDNKEILLQASEALNEAARLAYCRLVLFSGCLQQKSTSSSSSPWPYPLKTSGGMSRQDILELCGLCQTVLRLPLVQEHLSEPGRGTPLFAEELGIKDSSDDDNKQEPTVSPHATLFPQKRLECIQRIFLQMIGYNADYGTAEIKRIFYSPDNNHEFTRDEKIMEAFTKMMNQIKASLMQATMKISEQNFLSDQAQGGSTRIVAVDYSEHDIDAQTGRVLPAASSSVCDRVDHETAPIGQAMEEANTSIVENEAARRQRQEQQLRAAAVAAARLEQEILGRVLSLPEEERLQELDKAQQVSEQVVRQAMEIAPGPGRVDFLRSQDADTQRLMALHKLWQRHVRSKTTTSNNSNASSSQQQPTTIRQAPGFAPE